MFVDRVPENDEKDAGVCRVRLPVPIDKQRAAIEVSVFDFTPFSLRLPADLLYSFLAVRTALSNVPLASDTNNFAERRLYFA